METQRPQEITVQLLRDGAVEDTVTLNAANSWRHEWTDLSARYAWTVVETDIPVGYTVKNELQGITFTVTNTAAPCEIDPPLRKIVSGDTPATPAIFRFVMEAVSNTAGFETADIPMPEGAEDGRIIKDVLGGGEYEFGIIKYLRPGTYVYRVYEVNTGSAGYTYDNSEYTITCVVTEENNRLSAVTTVSNGGREVDGIVFDNPYKKTDTPPKTPPKTPPTIPKTGQLWWPVPVLLIAGLLLLCAGFARRRTDRRGN